MPKFVYKGLSASEQKEKIEAYAASIFPPTPRGSDDPYRADKLDDDDVKSAKKAAFKEWVAKRKKEYAEGVKIEADKVMFQRAHRHSGPKKARVIETVVFEKDKPVDIAEQHWLYKRLMTRIEGGEYPPDPHWELVREKAK